MLTKKPADESSELLFNETLASFKCYTREKKEHSEIKNIGFSQKRKIQSDGKKRQE